MSRTRQIANKMVVKITAWILTVFVCAITAVLSYRIEDGLFSIMGYIWQGPGDILFWCLAIFESFTGSVAAFLLVPKWFKIPSIRNIYSVFTVTDIQLSSIYLSAGLVGFFLGLVFSGTWKFLYLFMPIVY